MLGRRTRLRQRQPRGWVRLVVAPGVPAHRRSRPRRRRQRRPRAILDESLAWSCSRCVRAACAPMRDGIPAGRAPVAEQRERARHDGPRRRWPGRRRARCGPRTTATQPTGAAPGSSVPAGPPRRRPGVGRTAAARRAAPAAGARQAVQFGRETCLGVDAEADQCEARADRVVAELRCGRPSWSAPSPAAAARRGRAARRARAARTGPWPKRFCGLISSSSKTRPARHEAERAHQSVGQEGGDAVARHHQLAHEGRG